jgi:hypothetical protein
VNIYLILVTLSLPAPAGQTEATLELFRGLSKFSSQTVCQVHANNLADLQRAINADAVRRMGARVVGTCHLQPTPPPPAASAASATQGAAR